MDFIIYGIADWFIGMHHAPMGGAGLAGEGVQRLGRFGANLCQQGMNVGIVQQVSAGDIDGGGACGGDGADPMAS